MTQSAAANPLQCLYAVCNIFKHNRIKKEKDIAPGPCVLLLNANLFLKRNIHPLVDISLLVAC